MDKKEGEAIGALHHKDVGDIDLVWGKEGTGKSDGFGLAKLAKFHPEVLDNLQEILDSMRVTKRSANRIKLESDSHQASVRLKWDNTKKNWLLTAFEKKNSVSGNTTNTAETTEGGMRNDTATSQNTVSAGKVTNTTENKQGNPTNEAIERRKEDSNKQDGAAIESHNRTKKSRSEIRGNDGRGNNGSTTGREPGDLVQTEVTASISDEINEFGKPFILSSDGTTTFGTIQEESGLKDVPIKLSLGENYVDENGVNHGYGLLHIEASHGKQIMDASFSSVEEFAETVAKNYDTIREGGIIANNQTYLLEITDEHNNTLFIQLSRDGSYWNINSAGIFKKKYSRRKPEVYTRPALETETNTDFSGVNSGRLNGVTAPAGNSPQTSADKVTNTPDNDQGETEKTGDNCRLKKEHLKPCPYTPRSNINLLSLQVLMVQNYLKY